MNDYAKAFADLMMLKEQVNWEMRQSIEVAMQALLTLQILRSKCYDE